jgi:hypothetical protein
MVAALGLRVELLPVFDYRAEVRILATPKEATVYVDGFYAGLVDDFDGTFQRLPLPPGGHRIELFLEGHRTIKKSLYLQPGSTMKLRETLVPLAAGEVSEPPELAPEVPAPPDGTYAEPNGHARMPPPRAAGSPRRRTTDAEGMARCCCIAPAGQVSIDGRAGYVRRGRVRNPAARRPPPCRGGTRRLPALRPTGGAVEGPRRSTSAHARRGR